MNRPSSIIELPALIQNRVGRVIFAEDGLTIEKYLGFKSPLFVPGESIAAFRFGVQEFCAFNVTYGRQYFIETRDFQNKVSRIKLNSYYGVKDRTYYRVWAEILQQLWEFYLESQLSYYKELINMRQVFEIAGVTLHVDGISWGKEDKLKWNEIVVNTSQAHFVIQHIDDPGRFKCCVFSIHWNAVILQSLLKDTIKQPVTVRKSSSI
ncbi:MAG: hypothetical protein ABI203_06355 [Mucilaginibacter sp.]